MTTFIDTNVLIYLLSSASKYHSWSKLEFEKCKSNGPIIISDIVYAEFSIAMDNKDATDKAIRELACERLKISDHALYNAGRAFKLYKTNGGKKETLLPDFLIGAQAESENAPLLTVNARDFHKVFPKLKLISPTNTS